MQQYYPGTTFQNGAMKNPDVMWDYSPDGGVNYYSIQNANGASYRMPISREQFQQFSGVDPGTIENYVKNNPQPTTSTSGGSTAVPPAGSTAVTPTGSTGTGTGGYLPTSFMGTTYPDQTSYNNAVTAYINDQYNNMVKNANTAYQNGIITIQQKEQQLSDARQNAMDSINGYFNRISPDASQSGYGSAINKAVEAYGPQLSSNLPTQGATGQSTALAPYANDLSNVGDLSRYFNSLGQSQQTALNNATQYKGTAMSDLTNQMNALNTGSGSSSSAPTLSMDIPNLAQYYGGYASTPTTTTTGGSSSATSSSATPITQFLNSLT